MRIEFFRLCFCIIVVLPFCLFCTEKAHAINLSFEPLGEIRRLENLERKVVYYNTREVLLVFPRGCIQIIV